MSLPIFALDPSKLSNIIHPQGLRPSELPQIQVGNFVDAAEQINEVALQVIPQVQGLRPAELPEIRIDNFIGDVPAAPVAPAAPQVAERALNPRNGNPRCCGHQFSCNRRFKIGLCIGIPVALVIIGAIVTANLLNNG